jgi:Predicted membrane protein
MSQDKKEPKAGKTPKKKTEAKAPAKETKTAAEAINEEPKVEVKPDDIAAETVTASPAEAPEAEGKTETAAQETAAPVEMESEVEPDASEVPAQGSSAEPEAPTEEKEGQEIKAVFTEKSSAPTDSLKPVSRWARDQRLTSWQTAALLRARGWAGDKQVSEAEFSQALASTLGRKQGGRNG